MFLAYLDEAARTDGTFAVAGCLFSEPKAQKFECRWSGIFGGYGGCHMTDLVSLQGPFKGLASNQRDELIKEAVRLIRGHVEAGIVVRCRISDVESLALETDGYRTPYGLLSWLTAGRIKVWCTRNHRKQPIRYFFEDGPRQGEAKRVMNDIRDNPMLREDYRYAGHAFLSKKESTLLQSADFLAWESTKFLSETRDRSGTAGARPPRRSFRELVRPPKKFEITGLSRRTLEKQFRRVRDLMASTGQS